MSKEKFNGQVVQGQVNAFKYHFIGENLSFLMGQILTIIDASVIGEQNKAVKDLIRGKFSETQTYFYDMSWKPKIENENEGHEPRCNWEDGLIPYTEGVKHSFTKNPL